MSERNTGFRLFDVPQSFIDDLYENNELPTWDKRLAFYPNLYVELRSQENQKNTALGWVNQYGCIERLFSPETSGLSPRNREQVFALHALLRPETTVVVLTGIAGTGKAQPLDCQVMTPEGPIAMGAVTPGSLVCTPDGKVAPVIDVFPQGLKPVYRVYFSDHTFTECCDNHLWFTKTQLERDTNKNGAIRSLQEIRQSLRAGISQKKNHSIPMTAPVQFSQQKIAISPYLMGILLGDGCISGRPLSLSTADQQIVDLINQELIQYDMKLSQRSRFDYTLVHNNKPSWKTGNTIKNRLQEYLLWGTRSDTKFIPVAYKYNSVENRVALLQGLLDSDGTIDKRSGSITYSSTSQQLANDVIFLVQSLGGKATCKSRYTHYTYNSEKRRGKLSFRVSLSLPNSISPFRLDRKTQLIVPKTKYPPVRYIDKVEYIGEKETQCILIDHPQHLYLTDNFIVTHNTILTLAAALEQVQNNTYQKVIITRPMSEVGKYKLGALPGDVTEKFSPYLLNYLTNLEQFVGHRNVVQDLLQQSKFEITPLQLIRGASFNNCLVIADEMQVCSHAEVLTLGTRIGEGSKVVIMGDLNQRDEKIARDKTGLYKIMNDKKMRDSDLVAGLELMKCERSETAKLFASVFEE